MTEDEMESRLLGEISVTSDTQMTPPSRGSSPPRDRTQVSRIAGEFFTS